MFQISSKRRQISQLGAKVLDNTNNYSTLLQIQQVFLLRITDRPDRFIYFTLHSISTCQHPLNNRLHASK